MIKDKQINYHNHLDDKHEDSQIQTAGGGIPNNIIDIWSKRKHQLNPSWPSNRREATPKVSLTQH